MVASNSRAVWAGIRSLRSSPPNQAETGPRRRVFAAALEQSEQLFTAAEATPPSVRPILLFYGISQAGRAIVAAHGATQPTGGSHGLRASGLSGPLTEMLVRDNGVGAFQSIAGIVASPSLHGGVALGQLYAGLPALVDVLLEQEPRWAPALILVPEHLDGAAVFHSSSAATAWVYGVPKSVIAGTEDPRPQIAAFLEQYPTLVGWRFPTVPPVPVQVHQRDGRWGVRLLWLLDSAGGSGESDRQTRIRDAGVVVPGTGCLWVPPAMVSGRQPLAPIATWWAILYALSMVARYEPSAWVDALQPDKSHAAVPMESLLDAGLRLVPELILASLEDPGHWRSAVEARP